MHSESDPHDKHSVATPGVPPIWPPAIDEPADLHLDLYQRHLVGENAKLARGAIVRGICCTGWYSFVALFMLMAYPTTSLGLVVVFIAVLMAVTAVCFIVGGSVLYAKPLNGSALLRHSAIAGMILTALSLFPLWYDTLHEMAVEQSSKPPGYYPFIWVDGAAFWPGLIIAALQMAYCIPLYKKLSQAPK